MMRYTVFFCQKRYTNENLPPTHDSLIMHIKRVNFKSMVWVRCLQPKQIFHSVSGNGWYIKNSDIETVLMNKEPAPMGLIELTACSCKKSVCYMQTNESCLNPENVFAVDDDHI